MAPPYSSLEVAGNQPAHSTLEAIPNPLPPPPPPPQSQQKYLEGAELGNTAKPRVRLWKRPWSWALGLLLICVVGAVVGGVVGGTRRKHGSAQVENPLGYVCSFFRRVRHSEVLLSLLSSVEASHPCCLEGKSDLLVHWFRRIKIDVKRARSIGAKVC
jgi:hypothetical protein